MCVEHNTHKIKIIFFILFSIYYFQFIKLNAKAAIQMIEVD